jgi:hypothetical protein
MAKVKVKAKTEKYVPCSVKEFTGKKLLTAAAMCREVNPTNAPRIDLIGSNEETKGLMASPISPQALAVLTTAYWGAEGVKLGVSFTDNPTPGLRNKLLAHMNAWGEFCNVSFSWSQSGGQVRIGRGPGGYWSYLGVQILSVPQGQQTMNLQGFTERTGEAEFTRVVRHETGHTLGFPHEHLRAELVARLDPAKTLAYFRRTQGWDDRTIRSNVLEPLDEHNDIMGSLKTDDQSLMCYPLPGSITRDGRPIPGGNDFSAVDREFAVKLYPKVIQPPPPSPDEEPILTLSATLTAGSYILKRKE